MKNKVTLARSQQGSILWDLHRILDRVPEGERGTRQLVRLALRQFGVPWWRRFGVAAEICALLPKELDTVDMQAVLDVFERVLPIDGKKIS